MSSFLPQIQMNPHSSLIKYSPRTRMMNGNFYCCGGVSSCKKWNLEMRPPTRFFIFLNKSFESTVPKQKLIQENWNHTSTLAVVGSYSLSTRGFLLWCMQKQASLLTSSSIHTEEHWISWSFKSDDARKFRPCKNLLAWCWNTNESSWILLLAILICPGGYYY